MIKFDDVDFDLQEDNSVSSPSMARNESYNLKSEEVDEQGIQINNIYCSQVHENVLIKEKGHPPAKRWDSLFTFTCFNNFYHFEYEIYIAFSSKEIVIRKTKTK